MTSKERARLISLAMDMDPVISVGKGGISPELIINVEEALKKRELIKISVQKNYPGIMIETAETIAERSRAEVVQVIGRKIVLYKYSKDAKKHV